MRERGGLAECAGRRPGTHHDALCQLAGIGDVDAERSGGPCGRRPVPARQRHAQGPAGELGRAGSCAGRALYGSAGGNAEESGDSDLLSALVSGRKGQEVGVDGMHAEAAHHLECDGQERYPVARGRKSACLIFKTVADPEFSSTNTQF